MPDLAAMREKLFARANTNGDKGLSLEEFQSAGTKLPMGKGQSAEQQKAAFGKIDTDGDGSLTQDEMKSFGDKMSSQMQGMMLAIQSMMGSIGGAAVGGKPDIADVFGKTDGDGDGAISRAEFDKAAKDNPIAQLLARNDDDAFGKIDADGDGALSKDEVRGFGERLKDQMQGASGGGSSRADFMQAQSAYTNGTGGQQELASTLLRMLDGGKSRTGGSDRRA